MSDTIAPGAISERPSRTLWIAGGVLALASVAAATGLALKPSATPPAPVAASPEAVSPVQPAPVTHTPAKPVPRTVVARAAAPAAVCKQCGVVESVQAVTHKGQGSGVGAVAGGVLGAAVGNQMGKGTGRAAMTVLGAVGGGLAGNEIEKRTKSETVYEVQVRMDDGTLRHIERQGGIAQGARVVVDGNSLRLAQPAEAGS